MSPVPFESRRLTFGRHHRLQKPAPRRASVTLGPRRRISRAGHVFPHIAVEVKRPENFFRSCHLGLPAARARPRPCRARHRLAAAGNQPENIHSLYMCSAGAGEGHPLHVFSHTVASRCGRHKEDEEDEEKEEEIRARGRVVTNYISQVEQTPETLRTARNILAANRNAKFVFVTRIILCVCV